jgi:D-serine dehydratase
MSDVAQHAEANTKQWQSEVDDSMTRLVAFAPFIDRGHP